MLWAGLVQAIHSARISPSAAAWNISTAVLPGLDGTSATPHSAATSARCWGLARSRWALSRLVSAAFLAVPLLLWFRPWQYRLSVALDCANHLAAVVRSATLIPQVCATRSGV